MIILLYSDCGILSSKDNTQKEDVSPFVNISQYKLPARLDFCGEPLELDNPIMRERAEREFFINLQSPGQIILYLKRSGRYFPIFDSIFKQYNIPDDIKYLAVAESGLQNVMSPKQAYGIWQFIPTTAKEYNLQMDEYVDERLNIYKSTEAACKYLQRAYEVFGSWTLAACAYNMGFANLSNNIDFQSTRNFYELFLNEETSRYIFRIAVLKEILINHRKYGFDLSTSEIYKPFKTKQI
ncbi:MAG: lytic transglycosylase domain-containing protein, partial [Candidatus Kapaibacteriota bacterium]